MVAATNTGKGPATFQVTATVKVMGARGAGGVLAQDEDLTAEANQRQAAKKAKEAAAGPGDGGPKHPKGRGPRWVAKWKVFQTEASVPGTDHPGCGDGCSQLLLALIPTGSQATVARIEVRVLPAGSSSAATGSAAGGAAQGASTKSRVLMHSWLNKKPAATGGGGGGGAGKARAGGAAAASSSGAAGMAAPSALGLFDACPTPPRVHSRAAQGDGGGQRERHGHAPHGPGHQAALEVHDPGLQAALEASRRDGAAAFGGGADTEEAALQAALRASELQGGLQGRHDQQRQRRQQQQQREHAHTFASTQEDEDAQLEAAIAASRQGADQGAGPAGGGAPGGGGGGSVGGGGGLPSEEEQLKWALAQSSHSTQRDENAPGGMPSNAAAASSSGVAATQEERQRRREVAARAAAARARAAKGPVPPA